MPRKRRITHRRRTTFCQTHVTCLCNGHDYFQTFPTDDDLHVAWAELGPAIMEQWAELNPGTRPDAWWTYDAPERRRCINGVHPFDDPAHQAKAARIKAEYPEGLDLFALSFGKPRYIGKDQFGLKYEAEADYLDRLNLLTDGERAALADGSPVDEMNPFIPQLFATPARRAVPVTFTDGESEIETA